VGKPRRGRRPGRVAHEVLSYNIAADSWWCRSLRDGKHHEIAHTVIDGEYVRVVTSEDP